MKKVIITVSLITTVLVTTIAAIAAEVASKPAVIGVLFYADQCGSCKILDPKIQAVKKEFTDKPILFTRVDLTDDYTKSQSQMLASMLGISEIYNENAPKTGYMLLINAKDKKVLGKLTKTQSEEEIKTTIKTALDKKSVTEHPKSEHPSEHPKGEHPK